MGEYITFRDDCMKINNITKKARTQYQNKIFCKILIKINIPSHVFPIAAVTIAGGIVQKSIMELSSTQKHNLSFDTMY